MRRIEEEARRLAANGWCTPNSSIELEISNGQWVPDMRLGIADMRYILIELRQLNVSQFHKRSNNNRNHCNKSMVLMYSNHTPSLESKAHASSLHWSSNYTINAKMQ